MVFVAVEADLPAGGITVVFRPTEGGGVAEGRALQVGGHVAGNLCDVHIVDGCRGANATGRRTTPIIIPIAYITIPPEL